VPAWNTKLQKHVQDGKLVVIGIAQEQHPDRSRLFAQWHRLDWPILWDPINAMQVRGVPIEVAIDEQGIVRSLRPKAEVFEDEFLNKSFAAENTKRVEGVPPSNRGQNARDTEALRRRAEQARSSDAWRELGDALVLWGEAGKIDDAIDAYTQAIKIKPDDGDAHFRLGVCYRMRYDSPQRKPADFQMAVDCWTKARQIEPNQYIWRRRIEQYGPRLTKPYPFYDWVETAAKEIKARGELPVELKVLPTGSEIAAPDRNFDVGKRSAEPPDPNGRVARDVQNLILAEVTVVPPQIKPGETVRVHVTLRPNEQRKAHWNNEAEPLKLWIDAPAGWQVAPQLLIAPQGEKPETSEPRRLEFEVRVPADAGGTDKLAGYALYYACEDVSGTCQFLRQDIPVTVTIDR
jgi:tetratricopeptide (TPR) repeat protein